MQITTVVKAQSCGQIVVKSISLEVQTNEHVHAYIGQEYRNTLNHRLYSFGTADDGNSGARGGEKPFHFSKKGSSEVNESEHDRGTTYNRYPE